MRKVLWLLGLSVLVSGSASAQLPPPPVPSENPITPAKTVLGKVLFWDEQLSSDGTISCGTCHQPGAGGSDPRVGVHPGPDETPGTPDDILGSPGVVRKDAIGELIEDSVFGFEVQVTGRSANTTIGAAYAPALFWDGRATTTFFDPVNGGIIIPTGGGLESQAVGPIVSDVEMAHEGRTWDQVIAKLERSAPMGHASEVPADVKAAIAGGVTYRDLFNQAFGSPEINPERIAFAIATYERTLIPDDTPWDRFMAGNPTAMTPGQIQGWNFFQGSPCSTCHAPPLFTDQTFRNIGIRPPDEDLGRQEVTGFPPDRGRFKVPTLRNVGLKPTHMHNGLQPDVLAAINWYRPGNGQRSNDNLDPILPIGIPPQVRPALVDFLANALTDARVANEQFPFDRPVLHAGAMPVIEFSDPTSLGWPTLSGVSAYNIYRGDLDALDDLNGDGLPDGGYGTCISQGDPAAGDGSFSDPSSPSPGEGYFYLKTAVDADGDEVGFGAATTGEIRFVNAACP